MHLNSLVTAVNRFNPSMNLIALRHPGYVMEFLIVKMHLTNCTAFVRKISSNAAHASKELKVVIRHFIASLMKKVEDGEVDCWEETDEM